MKPKTLVFCSLIAALSPAIWADSVFDGTWRPEYPQKVNPNEKHDVIALKNGVYECRSCTPAYTIKADGADYAVDNNPDFDMRSVKVVDARTVVRSAKKGGSLVFESKLSADLSDHATCDSGSNRPPERDKLKRSAIASAKSSEAKHEEECGDQK